jgi:hypothetical protein
MTTNFLRIAFCAVLLVLSFLAGWVTGLKNAPKRNLQTAADLRRADESRVALEFWRSLCLSARPDLARQSQRTFTSQSVERPPRWARWKFQHSSDRETYAEELKALRAGFVIIRSDAIDFVDYRAEPTPPFDHRTVYLAVNSRDRRILSQRGLPDNAFAAKALPFPTVAELAFLEANYADDAKHSMNNVLETVFEFSRQEQQVFLAVRSQEVRKKTSP